MRLTIDVKGTRETIEMLKGFGREGKKNVIEITKIQAGDIERDAKVLAPVDTGKMQQSIKAEKITRFSWTITAYEIYAIFVEFGTRYMSAQPFLYPAWKRGIIRYKRDLRDAFVRLTKKYNK